MRAGTASRWRKSFLTDGWCSPLPSLSSSAGTSVVQDVDLALGVRASITGSTPSVPLTQSRVTLSSCSPRLQVGSFIVLLLGVLLMCPDHLQVHGVAACRPIPLLLGQPCTEQGPGSEEVLRVPGWDPRKPSPHRSLSLSLSSAPGSPAGKCAPIFQTCRSACMHACMHACVRIHT